MKRYDNILTHKWGRLLILVIAGFLGLRTSQWVACIATWVIHWGQTCPVNGGNAGLDWLTITSISWLVLLALWWFRTYDVRQGIEIAEVQKRIADTQLEMAATQNATANAQIQRDDFYAGSDKLLQDSPQAIEAGMQALISLSDTTKDFNSQIRAAFIKRLQRLPEGINAPQPNKNGIGEYLPAEIRVKGRPELSYVKDVVGWLYRQVIDGEPVVLEGMYPYYYEGMEGEFINKRDIVLDKKALYSVWKRLEGREDSTSE